MNIELKIDSLTFQFSKAGPVFFKNIQTTFLRNQLNFIQGKNGSGKSTLFRILQGKIRTDEQVSGTITLNNQTFHFANNQLPATCTDHVHAVAQNVQEMVADQFTVKENLSFAQLPTYPGISAPLAPQKKVCMLLEKFGIPQNKPVHLLSGGQKQILAIAMTLQKPTHVLLLDEPTSALDPKNAQLVMECLKMLAIEQNLIILIISHDKDLVRAYAEQSFHELRENADGTRSIHIISK